MSKERGTTRVETAPKRPDLRQEYHAIGISAVAAALPYRGKQKNEAYAPAQPKDDKRKTLTLADLDHLMV